MTKEQEKAVKSIQNFVNSTMDTTVVTAKEMKIVLNLIQQLQEEKQYIGLKVRNKISGKCGIVLHINSSGSIAVLESIEPKVVNTHDSWKTLEVIQNNILKRRWVKNNVFSDSNNNSNIYLLHDK